MKKIIFGLLLVSANSILAQELPDFKNITLKTPADHQSAEADVISAATYVLSTPFNDKDINRLNSLAFIIKWMTGTPDYMFGLDNTVSKATKGNSDVLGIYMACMAKYCLENKSDAKDANLVKLNSIKLLLAYCEDTGNNIKMTKYLKQLSEANRKGELEKELQ